MRRIPSALRDLVTLGHTHALVFGGTIFFASAWGQARVACTNVPSVRQVGGVYGALAAAAKQEHSHLDAGAANLDFWRHWVFHKVVSELHAHIQVALAGTIAKDR